MKFSRTLAVTGLALSFALPVLAQQTDAQARKEAKTQLKQQQKADKKQAKADKDEAKAANTKQAKKAAKEQDKANAAQPQ